VLFEPALADGRDEHVPRDRVEPGRGRAVGEVAEAFPREPDLGERLGREVERRLPVTRPTEMEAVDPHAVPVVQLSECACVPAGGGQELGVGLHHAVLIVVPPSLLTEKRWRAGLEALQVPRQETVTRTRWIALLQ
jgi:hypothetical protein